MGAHALNMAENVVLKYITDHYRSIPIVLNCVVVILCLCVFVPTGKVTNQFKGECILYSHLKVKLGDNDEVILDTSKKASTWGSHSTCNYVTFTPVVASLNSLIWCWFFYQNASKNETGTGLSLPALLFSCVLHALFSISLFAASIYLSAGKKAFCDNLTSQITRYDCPALLSKNWTVLDQNTVISYPFYTYLHLAEICCWLLTVMSLVVSIVAGYHILSWFGVISYKDDDDDEDEDLDDDDSNDIPYATLSNGHISMDESGSVIINLKHFDSRSVRSSLLSEPI